MDGNGQKSDGQTAGDRKENGHFAKGNAVAKGRILGSKNRTHIDLRQIKAELAASWDRVGGQAIFDDMAKSDPVQWAKLIVAVLPKEADLLVEQRGLNLNASDLEPDPVRERFHVELLELAGGNPITSETVLRQLEINRGKRNGVHKRSPPPPGDAGGPV